MGGHSLSLSAALAYVYENIVAADFDLIAVNADTRIHRQLAVGDVILPTVPRAGNNLAVHLTGAERAATVQAGVIDGVEGSVNIGEGDGFAFHGEFPDVAGGNFVFACGAEKWHSVSS